MGVNYRHHADKEKNRRAAKDSNRSLPSQLDELLLVVKRCEAIWALEDRVERGFGGGSRT